MHSMNPQTLQPSPLEESDRLRAYSLSRKRNCQYSVVSHDLEERGFEEAEGVLFHGADQGV